MKNCSVKKNVFANVLNVDQVGGLQDIEQSIKSPKEVIKILQNPDQLIGLEDAKEIQDDHSKVARALNLIPEFKEHGLLLPHKPGAQKTFSSILIDRIITTKEGIGTFINKLSPSGNYSGTISENVVEINGKLVSELSIDQLNTMAVNFMSTHLDVEGRTYVSKNKDGSLYFNPQFQKDYNRVMYLNYLKSIGTIADLIPGRLADPEPLAQARALKSVPLIAHINSELYSVNSKIQEGANKKGKYDKKEAAQLYAQREKLNAKKLIFKVKLTKRDVLEYFESSLQAISNDLALNKYIHPKTLQVYKNTIDMVLNTTQTNLQDNLVLDKADIYDNDFFRAVSQYGITARKLQEKVNKKELSLAVSTLKEEMGDHIDEKNIREVRNMGNSIRVFMQKFLKMSHIDAPLAAYIEMIVNKAEIAANDFARRLNGVIETMYNKLKDKKFDTKVLYQKNKDGVITGRMIDAFTGEYWRSANLLKLKTNPVDRVNKTLSLNPLILFEQKASNPERKEQMNELRRLLGTSLANIYLREAKAQWDNYKDTEAAYIAANGTANLNTWKEANSPVNRISNVLGGIMNPKMPKKILGSDRFLITIPREIGLDGKNTGYYDSAYKKLRKDKDAMEFYTLVRTHFIDLQMQLHNYENKFKPPTIPYFAKSITNEAEKQGVFKTLKTSPKKFAEKYLKESIYTTDLNKSLITGEEQNTLKSEVHTITDETRRRVNKELEANSVWKTLDRATRAGRTQARVMREEAWKRHAKQVGEDSSDDFLQAITMSNYATSALISKRDIEAKVNMAVNVMNSARNKDYHTSKENGVQMAREAVEKTRKHFLNSQFYNVADKDAPIFLGKKSNANIKAMRAGQDLPYEDVETGYTLGKIIDSVVSSGRFILLSWSPQLAAMNIGQAAVSNILKGADSDYYNNINLGWGYRNIMKSKNRKIVDRLFVVGDVVYDFDKSEVHKVKKKGVWAWLKNPMSFQTEAEKINQGAVALAVLRTEQVTDNAGNTMNLLDAISDDGILDKKWKSERTKERGIDLLSHIVETRVRAANAQASGDYINPLTIETAVYGKAVVMFKKWLPELLLDRFGERKTIWSENRETMGRFRGLARVIRNNLNKDTRGKSDEVELKAMWSAVREIMFWGILKVLTNSLRKGKCETMECKKETWYTLMTLNMMGKLVTDVEALMDPANIGSLIASPFAMESLFVQYVKLLGEGYEAITPWGNDGRYKVDTDFAEAGDLKVWETAKKLIPGYRSTFGRYQQLTNKLYRDPYLSEYYDKKK